MQTAHREKGFTLVEMMLAVALMAIVAAIVAPNAMRLLEEYQLGSAANEVGFEISRAKMQAVAQNQFVRVVIGGAGRSLCRQTSALLTGPWTPSSCDDATDAVSLPSTTSVSGSGPTFDRNGLATSAGSLAISNPAGNKYVDYSILGRVTIS